MYAQVTDGEVTAVGRLPNSARRLDTREWVMGLATAPTELVEACGWFPVTDTPPTFDPATEVLERGDVVLVGGLPVRDYTVRDKTQAELDAEQDAADREAKAVTVGQAIPWLREQAQIARGVTVTNTNNTPVTQGIIDNLEVFYDGFADLLEALRMDER